MAKLTATTFSGLARHLDGARSNRIGHNTTGTLVQHEGRRGVEVRLHGHHIITLWEDNTAIFTMCGYGTVTTRERLNQLLPMPFGVTQNKGVQEVIRRWDYSTEGGWAHWETDPISSTDVLAVSWSDDGTPAVSVMENHGRPLADFYPVPVR